MFPFINNVYLLAAICRFLLVSLNIEAILGEVTIGQRRKKLKEMALGNGLSDAYTATLTRLKAQKGNRPGLGLQALMWVLFSKRPLQTEELCHALGVEIGSAELDPENIPALRTILSSCLGLLTVEASSSTVRLVHFTLQEHFLNDSTLPYSSHSRIAEVCLTYLLFRPTRDLLPTLDSAPSAMALLEYASFYRGVHAKRGMTEKVKILGRQLLEGDGNHIFPRVIRVLGHHRGKGYCHYIDERRGLTLLTGLDGETSSGMMDAVAAIMETAEEDSNATDRVGSITLCRAIFLGQEAVVKILLDREDIDPNHGGMKEGTPPLVMAAAMGRERVVKMLLEREDIIPDQPDTRYGQTPLTCAVIMGRERIVKILLGREDVNPNQPDTQYGQTPLSWAAEKGHEVVVRMLLEREDVNPDQPDTKYGQTPLSRAAQNGHEVVVRMLLEREDVNPNQPDTKYGKTPIPWAAENGHEAVVKILLEREDVNPDQADTEYGQRPISWAAEKGHEGVVKVLLERSYVRPTLSDHENTTPLSLVLIKGHRGVARILLERADRHSDKTTRGGQTSFPPPARPVDEFFVEMSSRSHDTNTHIPDFKGQLQLPPAAEYERAQLVDLQDSISISADHGPPTQLPWWSRLTCIRPRKLFRR